MKPIQHPSNNDVLRAPPGADIDTVRPIAVTRVVWGDGTPGVISYWQPSVEELALMNAGQPLALIFIGHTHSPVLPTVDGAAT